MHRRTLLTITSILPLGSCLFSLAQPPYPSKAIRLIVPQPPGGFNDAVARLIGKQLADSWNQTVVVENQPGASTQIGTSYVARAEPDGYTLLVASFAHGTNLYLRKNLPYDTKKDFKPVALLGETPNVLVVPSNSPFKSVQDIVKVAKSKPGKLSYASAGAGTSPHLCMEMFKIAAGVDIVHVPYKGGAQQNTALLAGEVDVMFDNAPNVVANIKAGRYRALAVSSAKRTELVPDVPTVAEQGVQGFEMMAWFGMFAPKGMSDSLAITINHAVNKALQVESVRKAFAMANVATAGGTPADFASYMDRQYSKWDKVITEAKITVD